MKRVFLIDLMSVFFKSHMAMERHHLTTGDGLVISGVHGVLSTLLRIQQSEQPSAIVVVSDTPAPTFRHKMYSEYKAHRPPMAEEMVAQLPIMDELLQLAGTPVIRMEGFEADDILATMAMEIRDTGCEAVIVTADKDLMQVVGPNLFLYNTKKAGEVELTGIDGVRGKFGVDPDKVIEVLALMGDASDNVPGVKGVGIKTASDLVSRYGNLEGIYENLEDLGKKAVRGKLEEARELAFLSRELVTIDTKVEHGQDICAVQLPDWSNPLLMEKMLALGLRNILQRSASLAGSVESGADPVKDNIERVYHTVADEKRLNDFVSRLEKAGAEGKLCAFDLETTGLDAHACRIVGFSFSWEPGVAWYLPARFTREGVSQAQEDLFAPHVEPDEDLQQILPRLKTWYENPLAPKCGQNAKYDMNVLAAHGVHVQGLTFDTMLASFVIRPAARKNDLDTLSRHYLGIEKIPTSALIGSGAKQITMADVPMDKVAEYACEDADCTLRLVEPLKRELDEASLTDLYHKIDVPMTGVLARMEQAGFRVDVDLLKSMSKELEGLMSGLESEIHEMAGEAFNLNSPRQLAVILYEKLRLKPGKKTSSGYSTDVKELERLASEEPLPRKLLEYRQLAKLKGTYTDTLPALLNDRTGRVHTNFNQTIAATGRLSSTDPNLQNIPVRSEWGRRIRQAFIPADGHVLIDADYSQIELRLLAHISGDPELCRSFNEGADIHRRTAAAIFGVEESLVSPEMRDQAKVVNFGVIYGMSAFALAGNLEIPVKEAQRFIDGYFALYQGVREWSRALIEEARLNGYVTNLFGRRRYVEDLNADNRQLREAAERIAVNTPIQGSAADLIKRAMLNLDRRQREDLPGLVMLSQVHDELIFEVPIDLAEACAAEVQREMEQVMTLKVPLVAEPRIGGSWLEAK